MTKAFLQVLVSASIVALGCGTNGSDSSAQTQAAVGGDAECRWPASVEPSESGALGCRAKRTFDLCANPPDGGACQNACKESEYALTCTSAAPDATLRCRTLVLPTPSNTLFYCCPCN